MYVHVPFCVSKCPYCAFFSVPLNPELEGSYLEFLKENLKVLDVRWEIPPSTLYIGGGTPSVLSLGSLKGLFDIIFSRFGASFSEITVEVNPGTCSEDLLKLLKDFGVTRVSIGVQSLDDDILRFLGRPHTSREAEEAMELAVSYGFDVSVDFIFGVPGQSIEGLLRDIGFSIGVGVHHVSLYGLTIEEGTPFYRMGVEVDDEAYADMYLSCREFLEERGFLAYEISNFSLPGKECRHNQIYWSMGSYLGVGPSAVSFFPSEGLRVKVDESLDGPYLLEERLTPYDMAFESLFLSLRTARGLDVDLLSEDAEDEIHALSSQGYVGFCEGRLTLTTKGALLANEIAVNLSRFLVIS